MYYSIVGIFFLAHTTSAQESIGIGSENNLNENALLDINSIDQGILLPRMNQLERNNISQPADGLMIYNIDQNKLQFYNTKVNKWESLSVIPSGIIIPWFGNKDLFDVSGLGEGKLKGWALCNGNNSTPDLRGRFLAGYSDSDVDYETVGLSTVGLDSSFLTLDNLPNHTHDYMDNGHTHEASLVNNGTHSHLINYENNQILVSSGISDDGSDNTYSGGISTFNYNTSIASLQPEIDTVSADLTSQEEGNDQWHDNRPRYKVLYFIMKL